MKSDPDLIPSSVAPTIDVPPSKSTGGKIPVDTRNSGGDLTINAAASNGTDATTAEISKKVARDTTTTVDSFTRDVAVVDTADTSDTESDASKAADWSIFCTRSYYSCSGRPYRYACHGSRVTFARQNSFCDDYCECLYYAPNGAVSGGMGAGIGSNFGP